MFRAHRFDSRRFKAPLAVPEWSDFDHHGKNCIFLQSTVSVRLNTNEPNNGQNQQQPRPQTKAEIVAQREQVRMLAIALGNWREAARQCGLSEGRVLNWVVRFGWKLPKRIEAPHPREMLSPVVGVVTPAESLEQRLKQDAEATRLGLSTATRKASASLAEREGDEVVYVAAKLKDVVSSAAQLHGWNQPAGVNVNIANVRIPTEAEEAERRARHARLDAITAKLRQLAANRDRDRCGQNACADRSNSSGSVAISGG